MPATVTACHAFSPRRRPICASEPLEVFPDRPSPVALSPGGAAGDNGILADLLAKLAAGENASGPVGASLAELGVGETAVRCCSRISTAGIPDRVAEYKRLRAWAKFSARAR